jgi:NAD(P)-dependent dehydrogenase (short-subunit alcohol dehydrogenase family)
MLDPDRPVAIVTGGSRGIGAGLVAAYRSRGWEVVANARTGPVSDDPGVLAITGDVSDPRTGERLVCGALERYGRVDTLVNNAGLFISKPFTEYTPEDYGRIVGVNLTGFFTLTQRAVSEMVRLGRGHIVNITTTLVEHADTRVPSVLTSLTKGGLSAATKALAIEYAAGGIRVNAVSPGVVRTTMADPAEYDSLARLHPLGRVASVSDVVDAVLFLESAPFVTGEILHVDGGQSAGH